MSSASDDVDVSAPDDVLVSGDDLASGDDLGLASGGDLASGDVLASMILSDVKLDMLLLLVCIVV